MTIETYSPCAVSSLKYTFSDVQLYRALSPAKGSQPLQAGRAPSFRKNVM